MGLSQSSFLSDTGANSGYHVHGVRCTVVQGYKANLQPGVYSFHDTC